MNVESFSEPISALGEDGLIRLFSELGTPIGSEVLVPNGDDAGVFSFGSQATVATTDTLVEGTHFVWGQGAIEDIGRKLISVNLSDIAAMGAKPAHILLSFVFRPSFPVAWAKFLAAGIHEQCLAHGVSVLGGNVSQSSSVSVLTATALGYVSEDSVVRRTGAKLHDNLYVTGYLGCANAGLRSLASNIDVDALGWDFLTKSLWSPIPRVEVGYALAQTNSIHAMCDISDGLGKDLRHLLSGTSWGAEVWSNALPIHPTLKEFCMATELSAVELAIEGGEEYELLFAAPSEAEDALRQVSEQYQVPISRIGKVIDKPEFVLVSETDTKIELSQGYVHFREIS